MPGSVIDTLVHDGWLSAQLGYAAYRVPDDVDPDAVTFIDAPCFAYAKVPVDEVGRAHRFESAGFRLVDTNVVLEKTPTNQAFRALSSGELHDDVQGAVPHAPGVVRDARPEDEDAVSAIAASSFRWSRFHQDPAIAFERANAIKASWGRSFFRGVRGDCCLVAERDGVVAGFLIALENEDLVTTDLIATHPEFQRRGVARALIQSLEGVYPDASRFRVGTQLVNVPSLNLYGSLGYVIAASSYVFHFHRASV